MCRQCENYVGKNQKDLDAHINRVHVDRRSATNLSVLTQHLFDPIKNTHDNHWVDGLAFLHSLNPSEPPFRQSLLNKITGRASDPVIEAAIDTIEACVHANKHASQKKLRNTKDFDSHPIWLLIILFEQLILYPTPGFKKDDKSGSLTSEVMRRINLFRSGQIKLLYEESRKVKSKTALDFARDPSQVRKDAQAAADVDNLRSCNARLTKSTPVAPVSDHPPDDEGKNGGNINTLIDLHPDSLNVDIKLSQENGRVTRSNNTNGKKIHISPKSILKILGGLNRGKAGDINVGTLDLFIKIANYQKRSKKAKYTKKQKLLAKFFSIVANNSNIPEKIGNILRTTYLVALEKDPTDLSKLRPLGVPSAIRRITAICILHHYRSRFANHVLPFNYAISINGGIDIITTTMRLGVEKYIKKLEDSGRFPTRALVSLDISNMFNAISRQKLREIIHSKFPELIAFADLLYEKDGFTGVKLIDGRWKYIPVKEGFSQGCPMSPIFAAIVLNEILSMIDVELREKAASRLQDSNKLDDDQGGLPLIMAFVDDTNALLPHEDVHDFLKAFRKYGEPLGARLNVDKTRIMTTCKNTSLIKRMRDAPWARGRKDLIDDLELAIKTFSRNKKDGSMVEVQDGLRVLGVPIGNNEFCKAFISAQLAKAKVDASKILEGLDDLQTKLQVFRQCTVHKMTHLFASDVLIGNMSKLPKNWHLWNSAMCTEFNEMVDSFLCSILQRPTLPSHAHIIASMSSNEGGLGLQNPRCTAIPSCVLTLKRCIDFTQKGVWVGKVNDRVTLPSTITSLFKDWETSTSDIFTIFRTYSPSIINTCVHESIENRTEHFLFESSPNTCKERIRDAAARRIRNDNLPQFLSPIAKAKIGEILEPSTSKALLDMPRIDAKNRQNNVHFLINLKRKLRLELWDKPVRCSCGDIMDVWGDHAFNCKSNTKTQMSNQIRDGIVKLFTRILYTVRMIDSKTAVDTELEGYLDRAPNLRPFDLYVTLDHLISDSPWKTPLRLLGFDVTVIPSAASSSSTSQSARKHESIRRLRDAEQMKLCRDDYTNKSGFTLSGDDIIGDILESKAALIPIAVSEFGQFGPLFRRFLFNDNALPLNIPANKFKNAHAADKLARSKDVPRGILQKANDIWRHSNPDDYYGFSHKAKDPLTYAEQQLGNIFLNASSNHILRVYKKVKPKPVNLPKCGQEPLLCHYIDPAPSNTSLENLYNSQVDYESPSTSSIAAVHSV